MLTSRGKRKAVLISVEDFERLRQMPRQDDRWAAWLAESDALAADILKRRGGRPSNGFRSQEKLRRDEFYTPTLPTAPPPLSAFQQQLSDHLIQAEIGKQALRTRFQGCR